jgi:hypothetical protein
MKVWSNGYLRSQQLEILEYGLKQTSWLSCSIHEWTWSDDDAAVMAYALHLLAEDPTLLEELKEKGEGENEKT